jgi:predicted RNA-binding Zn-ribbon protein involved in translation (DUF1610 family)
VPPQSPAALLNFTTGTLQVIRCLAPAKGNHVADQATPPEVGASSACPDCGTEMVIVSITPILFLGEFEDLSLACQKCGSTKVLRIKRGAVDPFKLL